MAGQRVELELWMRRRTSDVRIRGRGKWRRERLMDGVDSEVELVIVSWNFLMRLWITGQENVTACHAVC